MDVLRFHRRCQRPDEVGFVKFQRQFHVLNVASHAGQRRFAASALVGIQHEIVVGSAADTRRARDLVHGIVGLLLPRVMHQQQGDAVLVGDRLQRGDVAVVAGIGYAGVVSVSDALKGIDDHQRCVGILREEVGELFLQA